MATEREAKGKAEAVLTFLRTRFQTVPEEVEETILKMTDPTALESWIGNFLRHWTKISRGADSDIGISLLKNKTQTIRVLLFYKGMPAKVRSTPCNLKTA